MASSSSAAVGHEHENVKPEQAVLTYMSGFGAELASEALAGALPVGQNSPQKCPFGLYAEQLSGTAFTAPRARNRRSWLYRIRPAVVHDRFVPAPHVNPHIVASFAAQSVDPNQMRWLPPALPGGGADEACTWVEGLRTMCGSGDPASRSGLAIYTYTASSSMVDSAFYSADGEMLVVPQHGTLHVQTEMGFLDVAPGEIVVLPRGVRFRVGLDVPSRGYALEVFNGAFTLPDLGPIGANGLANPRDFLYPVASFEDREVDCVLMAKFGGKLFTTLQSHSPFDVVAWHGNYAPYKYDLAKFNTMNTVSYDHADPSIFTVLTVPTDTPGVALADFVIFPPRWMVAEHTFRPPYYHRNVMSEYMGMVWGKYDAKVGFQPGGSSLHPPMSAHGPDSATFLRASNAPEGSPDKFTAGLAFMFESFLTLKLSDYALHAPHRDLEYQKCWSALPRTFNPAGREAAGDLKPLSLEEAAAAAYAVSSAAHVGAPPGAAPPGRFNFLHGSAHGPVLGDGRSSAGVKSARPGGGGEGDEGEHHRAAQRRREAS